jgi:hypothetical protein
MTSIKVKCSPLVFILNFLSRGLKCKNRRNKGKWKIMGKIMNDEIEEDLQTMRIKSWHALARDRNE